MSERTLRQCLTLIEMGLETGGPIAHYEIADLISAKLEWLRLGLSLLVGADVQVERITIEEVEAESQRIRDMTKEFIAMRNGLT